MGSTLHMLSSNMLPPLQATSESWCGQDWQRRWDLGRRWAMENWRSCVTALVVAVRPWGKPWETTPWVWSYPATGSSSAPAGLATIQGAPAIPSSNGSFSMRGSVCDLWRPCHHDLKTPVNMSCYFLVSDRQNCLMCSKDCKLLHCCFFISVSLHKLKAWNLKVPSCLNIFKVKFCDCAKFHTYMYMHYSVRYIFVNTYHHKNL